MAKILNLFFASNPYFSSVNYLHNIISDHLKGVNYEVINLYLSGPKLNDHDIFWEKNKNIVKQKRTSFLFQLPLRKKLTDFIRKNNFDLILCDGFSPVHLLTIIQKKLALPPCISIIHGPVVVHHRHHKRLSKSLKNNWKLIGVSNTVTQCLIKQNFGATSENTITIDNAINFDELKDHHFSCEQAREILDLPRDSFIFGTIGRLVSSKRHSTLITSVKYMMDHGLLKPDMIFVIIGGGVLHKVLTQQINILGVDKYVKLLGPISNASHYVKAFNIGFMTSDHREGFGLATIELISGGIPTIVSDTEVFKHIVFNKLCHFPVNCPEELAKKFLEFYNLTEPEREKLGQSLLMDSKK